MGSRADAGMFPIKRCAEPELAPHQPLNNADWRIMARLDKVTSPHGKKLWEEALDQVETGRSEGPSLYDEDRKLCTGRGPLSVSPA